MSSGLGSHRTPTDGAHFGHAQNIRHGNAALKERSGSPYGRHSRAVKSPATQLDLRGHAQRSLCKRLGDIWHLHGDVTAGIFLCQFGAEYWPFSVEN